ncbi:MAG: pseudouridine synthase, partial [Desulfotomaculaceae bacterium]|nr:pseudouridine synthase [Desulfotomaculaceae bacterium]
MNGFINVLKPPGMTSHDVVDFIRRLLGIKKVGHTGTLDPGAAGVLLICLGSATRL